MLKTIEKTKRSAEAEMDAEMDRMKRLPRGSFKAKPGATDLRNCKVKISMYLDADILEYFRLRAGQPNAAPYQTQINNELRSIMESRPTSSERVKDDILSNKEFLRALKAKLQTVEDSEGEWTEWHPMPKPEKCREIDGPASAGLYQVRNKKDHQLILFGVGEECQNRMRSLYPEPYGTGTRNNEKKRKYIYDNWRNLEYRTLETRTKDEAVKIERLLKAEKNHLFNT